MNPIQISWTWKLREWIDDSFWSWRNSIYFRFYEYNDNIDRCAFFEELNYGWLQMYSDKDQYYSLVVGDDNELKNELIKIDSNK